MEIDIGKFKIESDKTQFILSTIRPKGKCPGREIEEGEVKEVIGYYSSLNNCLCSIPNKAMLRSDAASLRECVDEINHYRNLIKAHIGEA